MSRSNAASAQSRKEKAVRNRIIHTLPVVLIVIAAFYCTSSTSGEVIKSQDEPQQVTLFSRAAYLTDKNQGYGRSAFNFQYSVRSDDEDWTRITRNYYNVLYGNISMNHGSDWFSVSSGDEPSRIKDLGELRWSEVLYTPLLPANPRPYSGIRAPRRGGS